MPRFIGVPYATAEMSHILEANTQMIQVAEMAGARRYKTHRMYVKMLAKGS